MTIATAFPDQYVLRGLNLRPLGIQLFAASATNGEGRAIRTEQLASARKFATPADAILYALSGAIPEDMIDRVEVVRIDHAGTRELAVLGTVRDLATTPAREERRAVSSSML